MRKTKDILIEWGNPCPPDREPLPGENRDHGKLFRLTEMPAMQAEEWANRATLALLPRLSREVDPEMAEELKDSGMSSIARAGRLLGGIQFPEVKELMRDILATCVQIVPDPKNPHFARPIGVGGAEDVAEIETLRLLREEALNLHTGFTFTAGIFRLISATSMMEPAT